MRSKTPAFRGEKSLTGQGLSPYGMQQRPLTIRLTELSPVCPNRLLSMGIIFHREHRPHNNITNRRLNSALDSVENDGGQKKHNRLAVFVGSVLCTEGVNMVSR